MSDRRLEIASGFAPADGFEHLDLNPNAPHVEHLCDFSQPLPFEDDTFVEIRAVDCLEHASYRDTETMLREWVRVLAPGGGIFIQTPDAETMMQWYISGRPDMVMPEFKDQPPIVSIAWRVLGGHADNERVEDGGDFRLNAHYALFSMSSLQWYCDRVGLHVETIARNPFPNLQLYGRKL